MEGADGRVTSESAPHDLQSLLRVFGVATASSGEEAAHDVRENSGEPLRASSTPCDAGQGRADEVDAGRHRVAGGAGRPATLAPGTALPFTRIGRGGHPWLSIRLTQARKATTSVICWSERFGFGLSRRSTSSE